MGTDQDEKKWEYARQNCGTPYTSKLRFRHDCGYRTVVPVDLLRNTVDDSDE